jgi:hypothetical protein
MVKVEDKTLANGYSPCVNCDDIVHKKSMTSHLRYACEHVPGSPSAQKHGEGELPPGSLIGFGIAQHKKRWTWKDLENSYPRNVWVEQMVFFAPLGGVIWNGLHVDLIAGQQGCRRTTGNAPGRIPVYEKKIPLPHWDIYMQSLTQDQQVQYQPEIGLGQTVPPAAGPLEDQIFVDSETGERLVNPY